MKAVIFDLDGVLIDSMKAHVFAWEKVFSDYGIEVDDYEIYKLEGERNMEIPRSIAKIHNIELTNEEIDSMRELKKTIYRTFDVRPYDILFYLHELKKRGLKLAVGTGGRKEVAEEKINEFFPNIFDIIISSDNVKHGKPDPETYLKALEKLNIKSSEAVVIENAPLGVKAAINAQIKVYALKTTLTEKELHEADKIFDNHEILFDYLLDEIDGKL